MTTSVYEQDPTRVAYASLKEAYTPIQRELDLVRAGVNDLWIEALQLLNGSTRIRPMNPGKLLRPALCLLSASALGATDLGRFVPLATGVEALHVAALAHDDVIDGAKLRRGALSLNAMWDDRAGIMGGDYLVARSIELMTRYGSTAVVQCALDSIRLMTESELSVIGHGTDHFDEQDCLHLAEQKTGSLFSVACASPAYFLMESALKPLEAFGLAFGITFQIVDDVLDIVQSEATLGKPSCSDLAEGKKTLPILFMSELLDTQDAARLHALKGTAPTDADRQWVAEMLAATGALKRAEAVAAKYSEKACAALDSLPPSIYRDAMLDLADLILVRNA